MVFGRDKTDQILLDNVNGLSRDEKILYYFFQSQEWKKEYVEKFYKKHNRYPIEDPYQVMTNNAVNVPKKWTKDTGFFSYFILTNRRLAKVDVETRNITKFVNLTEVEFLGGKVTGEFSGTSGLVTIMKGGTIFWEFRVTKFEQVMAFFKLAQSQARGESPDATRIQSSPSDRSISAGYVTQTQSSSNIQSNEDPLKVLKLRFVKGEITKEEFEETKKLLE